MMHANDPMDVDLSAARKEIAEETKDMKKRVDPSGRLVPEKSANKPFFVYQEYRKKQEAEESAKAERKRVRFEKLARGEQVGPDPDDPPPGLSFGQFMRVFVTFLLMGLYAGYFIRGDPLWGYENKWLTIRHWVSMIPDGTQRAYTERQLAKYDGSNPEMPLLLAIDGIVYDVSEGRRIYGPGGGYHQFAGRDAARAYVTGCFKEHLTHDVRGFNEEEAKSLAKWKKFYAEHKSYRKVGTVYHAPIHPSTPIPPPCNQDADKDKKEEEKPAAAGPQLPPAAPAPESKQKQQPPPPPAHEKKEL